MQFEKDTVLQALVELARHRRGGKFAAVLAAEKLGVAKEELEGALNASSSDQAVGNSTNENGKAQSLSLAWHEFLEKELRENT